MPNKRKPDPAPEPDLMTDEEYEALLPMPDLPTEPTQEGFFMTDDDEDPPGEAIQRDPMPEAIPHRPGAQTRSPAPPGAPVAYESRIQILEAFQYAGNLTHAPYWIDRSWIAWAEYDEVKKIEPGPCLRVPLEGPQADKLCRIGDYVVRQSMKLTDDLSDTRIEVWPRADFEKFFLPKEK